jgi:hypothetical protein
LPETEAAHERTDVFAVQSALCGQTDRIGAGSEFHLEAKPKTSLLIRSGSGHLDGMTSLVAYQGVGDPALYPLQRRAQPSATDAAAPEDMQMRRSPSSNNGGPLRGHAGVMQ